MSEANETNTVVGEPQGRSIGKTDPGRKRAQNQDSYYINDSSGLWIVADGMGGHQGGEIASAIVCEELPLRLAAGDSLHEAFYHTQHTVIDRGTKQPELKGLGSTVVVVREVSSAQYEICWAGDSRIYRWRSGQLEQISEDHSVVQRLLRSGVITPEQAINHPQQHVISSCLGTTSSEGLEIGHAVVNWQQGDWLLLCSDGLTDEINDIGIANILRRHTELKSACDELVQTALDNGGSDNVSVVLIVAPEGAPDTASPDTDLPGSKPFDTPDVHSAETSNVEKSSESTSSYVAGVHPAVWGAVGSIVALGILLVIKYFKQG